MKIKVQLILLSVLVSSLTAAYLNLYIEHSPADNPAITENFQDARYKENIDTSKMTSSFYKVAPRFDATVTRELIKNANSILDIIPPDIIDSRTDFQSTRITLLSPVNEITAIGTDETLTQEQLNLLNKASYSTNLRITSLCQKKDKFTLIPKDDSIACYLTLVPEQQAEYSAGYSALIHYLEENSEHLISKSVFPTEILPCRINFTITKKGEISNVILESTSGSNIADNQLLQIIRALPGIWIPAKNASGNAIDQQLIFFFGNEGC